ncbi:MAG TPA: hypothetical protein VL137_12135 [Polyangiaceae bacterium]|nr:hypothetical protein [Polyangiaceae bacterium]
MTRQTDDRALHFSLMLHFPCTHILEGDAVNLSFGQDPQMNEDGTEYGANDFRYEGPDGCQLILRISGIYDKARIKWTDCADQSCPFSKESMTCGQEGLGVKVPVSTSR